jgi:hypothetical protein
MERTAQKRCKDVLKENARKEKFKGFYSPKDHPPPPKKNIPIGLCVCVS